MEIDIISKKENPLLERTEVHFKATHAKEKTPQREAVRDKLAAMLNVGKDKLVVDTLKSDFGRIVTVGYAKIYKTKEQAFKVERNYVLRRNGLKPKEEKKPAQATPAKGKEK